MSKPKKLMLEDRYQNTEYNEFGIHIRNMLMFFEELGEVTFDTRMGAIRAFTSCNPFRHFKYQKMGFRLERISHNKRKIWFEGNSLEFSRFSDLIQSDHPLKLIPFKMELLNYKKRKGICHYRSFYFFRHLGGILMTSYVDDSLGKCRVVHSYIKDEERKRIIDYTSNLVISESDYEELLHPTVINQITQEEYLSDQNSVVFSAPIPLKFYCLFREELQNGHTFLGGEEWEVSSEAKQKIR